LDEDSKVLERRSYDAFGEMTFMAPAGVTAAVSPTGVDVGFQGQIRDAIINLYQMGFRWYNPTTGRWLSRDPIKEAGGLNQYSFSSNQPIDAADPLGLMIMPSTAWSRLPSKGDKEIGTIHSRPMDNGIPIASDILTHIALGYADHFFLVLNDGSRFSHGGSSDPRPGDVKVPLRIPENIDAKKFKECLKRHWPKNESYNPLTNNCRLGMNEAIKKCLEENTPTSPPKRKQPGWLLSIIIA
jgi:RHS repeat-associated protein